MNKLDYRFLDFGTTVKGTLNDAPSNYVAGDQYIVGKNPIGAFEGVEYGSIARYDGRRWVFTPPSSSLPALLDITTGELLTYGIGTGWDCTRINSRLFGDMLLREVEYAIEANSGMLSSGNIGQRFLNTEDRKIYTATGEDTWDNGFDAPLGYYLIGGSLVIYDGTNTNISGSYESYENGVSLYSVKHGTIVNGNQVKDDAENVLLYKYGRNLFTQIYPVCVPEEAVSKYIKETVTETHELTSNDVKEKKITLDHNVVEGDEKNVLCFVNGLLQPVDTAFSVLGNILSWNDLYLDGNVSTGDVFIVQYLKNEE